MGAYLTDVYSHPGILLSEHTLGVYEKVCRQTTLATARAAALFHDFGKVNPNFQRKLRGERHVGYSHHAYLSAFLWLVVLQQNRNLLKTLGLSSPLDVLSVTALVAKHHGDLPDLHRGVFELEEAKRLTDFLRANPSIHLDSFLSAITPLGDISFTPVPTEQAIQVINRIVGLSFTRDGSESPVGFFLATRQAFASLISADKQDAAGYLADSEAVSHFCSSYSYRLTTFLGQLSQDTEINRLRTQMRTEAAECIKNQLSSPQRTFALTAPTGSGKTLMLLALAGEIIKARGPYRIMYVLPFLSITEQVFSICSNVFGEQVSRIDSRAENAAMESIQADLDGNPEAFSRLLQNQFAEDTFDFPFIITTFVRFFEALLSNKNATLLKLPSFTRAIFLIDEIQALPPRLYTFFVALLDAFCRMFDSYAIISSATMPDFKLPTNDPTLPDFFDGYLTPPELLSTTYFRDSQFNRYSVEVIPASLTVEGLAEHLLKQERSTLVILNTIDDTRNLYEHLTVDRKLSNVMLLNTHFTPNDRLRKLEIAKRAMRRNMKLIVVSTQLVEAGVDIDFPTVYRDLAPLSNIVQAAGRCNRNNALAAKGQLVVFELERDGRKRWNLIYRGPDERLVFKRQDASSEANQRCESDLFDIQRVYFDHIRRDLLFGYHNGRIFVPDGEIYFVERIKQAAFAEIGKFRLIDETEYGNELRYYVPYSDHDDSFTQLRTLVSELRNIPHDAYDRRRIQQLKIEAQLRAMAGQIIHVRIKRDEVPPLSDDEECCGLMKLDRSKYDPKLGIKLDTSNQII